MVYYGIKMFHMDFTYATYVHKCNICNTCNNIISCLHFSKIVTTRCPWSVQPGATTCWQQVLQDILFWVWSKGMLFGSVWPDFVSNLIPGAQGQMQEML